MSTSVCYCCERTGHYANKCNIRFTAFCTFCKAQGHLLTACKRKIKIVQVGELGGLGVLEVREGVQTRGGHQCSLDQNFFPTARKHKHEEERWHSSSRR